MTRPVRTLLFSTLYPSSVRPGHGIFVETRLRELLKSGKVETRVVAPVPWFYSTDPRHGERARMAATPARETRLGIDVLHPRYPVIPKVGMSLAPILLALASLGTLRQVIAEGFDFDVIDAHYYYPDGVAAAWLGRHLGKPVTVTARGTDVNLIANYPWPRKMLQWAERHVDASIGVSAALVERMRAMAFDPQRLHVMRNGVDLERFRPLDGPAMRQALAVTGSPLLLAVGNLHEHKGQYLAIQALALLRRGPHPQARLMVVGDGPDRKLLQRLAAELDLADAVHFAGVVPNTELARWYSAADVLLLCSSREGWPNVLLESLACGTPVVASDVGGVAEIVQCASAGRRVELRTAKAFADAVCALVASGVSRAAVRRYAEQFSWERTSQDQLDLFGKLAAGAGIGAAYRNPRCVE